jgi:hypothetical protein
MPYCQYAPITFNSFLDEDDRYDCNIEFPCPPHEELPNKVVYPALIGNEQSQDELEKDQNYIFLALLKEHSKIGGGWTYTIEKASKTSYNDWIYVSRIFPVLDNSIFASGEDKTGVEDFFGDTYEILEDSNGPSVEDIEERSILFYPNTIKGSFNGDDSLEERPVKVESDVSNTDYKIRPYWTFKDGFHFLNECG